MPEITLTAETGRTTGSRSSGRLRAEGKIPGVIYGHGTDPTPIAVDARSLRAALTGDAGLNALLNLQLDGTSQLAMAKDIQRDPVRNTVSHVDFLIVSRDEVVTADVTIVLTGEAEQVHRADGVIAQELFTITIHAKPDAIPHQLEVDISEMRIGDSVRVDDLDLPAGVSTEVDGDVAVVMAQPPQVTEADLVPEGAEAAGEEGAAEGDAGSAGSTEDGGDDAASSGDAEG
jgi:large subunit ribosomal protein L25